MMTETIRAGSFAAFSTEYTPAAPGPATSLLMDLLICLPALLVLARRVFDPTFSLRLAWSALPMGLLAVWAAASVLWSDDKFSAVISAANWGTALVFIWSTSQLVRSWLCLRLVAGVCFGLLLVLIVSGWYYRLIDWPDLRRSWQETSAQLLKQMQKEPGSRDAEQFGKNIASGTPLGFSVSTNTYGALLVLTMAVSTGVALQRRRDRDSYGWVMPIAASLVPAAALLVFTRGKAVGATALLGTAALAALAQLDDWPRRYARRAYFIGVGICLLGAAALVGHGLFHHSLPTSSLNFRWHYWVASARLFAKHPIAGVGWENFGSHYLAFRLPLAPEEIRDPHDFFVRAFVELGAIGGLLMISWMLLLWWELSGPLPQILQADAVPSLNSPRGTSPPEGGRGYPAIAIAVSLALVAVGLNILISFDWAAPGAFLLFEVFRRLLFLVFLLGGLLVVVLPSMTTPNLDDRPAPWVLTGIRVGLGLFLLHNLIEFSLFEPGATSLFALLAGSALGIRLVERSGASPAQTGAGQKVPGPRNRTAATAALVAGGLAWLGAAAGLAVPVALAEASARDGDEQMRQASVLLRKVETFGEMTPDTRDAMAGANLARAAAADFESALRLVPYNADYALRAAESWRFAGLPSHAGPLLATAIAVDPSNVNFYLTRAQDALEKPGLDPVPNEVMILRDFARALELDPNNVRARIDYAAALEHFGHRGEAADQYARALWYNAQLPPEENKRLKEQDVVRIQQHCDQLLGARGR